MARVSRLSLVAPRAVLLDPVLVKLSDLYQHEINERRKKFKLSRKFSEEIRIQGLQEREMNLKENRGLKQRVFVKSCYDRQWKESCDDVRTLESRAVIDKLMFDRKSTFAFKETNTKDINGYYLKKTCPNQTKG